MEMASVANTRPTPVSQYASGSPRLCGFSKSTTYPDGAGKKALIVELAVAMAVMVAKDDRSRKR
jgi:hypothetical protein